jgi:hypothetical protein
MPFNDLENKRIKKLMVGFMEKHRPPVEMRTKLDLGYHIKDYSVVIFEIRPLWSNPDKTIEEPVAKATYVKSANVWKIYWQRSDLKWHRYDMDPEVDSFEEFLGIVDADEYCCFWG